MITRALVRAHAERGRGGRERHLTDDDPDAAGVTSQSHTRSAPRAPAPRSSPVARSGRSAIATRTPRGENAASSAESSAGSRVATSIARASAPRAARRTGRQRQNAKRREQRRKAARAAEARWMLGSAPRLSVGRAARAHRQRWARRKSLEVGRQQRVRRLPLPALRREPRFGEQRVRRPRPRAARELAIDPSRSQRIANLQRRRALEALAQRLAGDRRPAPRSGDGARSAGSGVAASAWLRCWRNRGRLGRGSRPSSPSPRGPPRARGLRWRARRRRRGSQGRPSP